MRKPNTATPTGKLFQRNKRPQLRRVKGGRGLRITPRGLAILTAASALLGAGIELGVAELVMLGIIGLTLLFASLLMVAAAASVRSNQITVTRVAPPGLFCGQTGAVTVTVTPSKDLMSGYLTDLTYDGLAALGTKTKTNGNTLQLQYTITPTQTGHWNLGPLKWQQGDIFGLWLVTWWLGESSQLVAWPRTTALPVADTFRVAPSSVGNAINASPDDVTLRQYVPGDDLRRVHWATTARKGTPMVRQNGGNAKNSVRVLIDPGLMQNGKLREWALEHGASVACSALESDHQVQIVGGAQGYEGDFIDCQVTGRQQILSQIAQFAALNTVSNKAGSNRVVDNKTGAINFGPVNVEPPTNEPRDSNVVTYAIVGANFAPKPSTAGKRNYAVVVGNSATSGHTAAQLRTSGWRVVNLPKPISHQAAWHEVGA